MSGAFVQGHAGGVLKLFEEQGRDKLVLAVENLLGEIIWQKDAFRLSAAAQFDIDL